MSHVCILYKFVQYSQRETFIWTLVTAIYLNVFAENDHRDRCFAIFLVVTGVQLPTTVNTVLRGVQTSLIPMAGHCGPLIYSIYMYNVDDENPLTAMIPRRRPTRIHAFGHRDTRGSWPPGSTGVRPRCRPRVDNSDHLGQTVYEGSALAVL